MRSTGVIESKCSELSTRNFGKKEHLFLKDNESQLLQKLPPKTQTLLYIRLKSNQITNTKIVRHAIQFFQSIQASDWPKGEKFVAAILQTQNPIECFTKTIALVSKISSVQFWRFISPSKTEIYSKENLQTILNASDPLLQMDLRTPLLPFFEGGKDQIENLLIQPPEIGPITENQIHYLIQTSSSFESFLKKIQRLFPHSFHPIFLKVKLNENLGRKEKEAFIRFVLFNNKSSFDFDSLLKKVIDLNHLYGEKIFLAIANHPQAFSLQCNYLLNLFQKIINTPPSIELEDWITAIENEQISPNQNPSFLIQTQRKEILIDDLEEFKFRFATDRFVQFPLSDEEISIIFSQIQQIQAFVMDWKYLPYSDLIQLSFQISNSDPDQTAKLLAIVQLAIQDKFGIFPYVTQTATVLGILISSKKNELKGRIAQVKTGEGKSTILTMMAFLLAKQGRSVDIISSSSYLAKRDQKKYSEFFHEFGITSSHISYKHQKPVHFKAQILYGSGEDFEFALLKDRLYFTNLYAARNEVANHIRSFDCAIVDEVDNLFIDTAQNSARIAFPQSGISNHWVYSPILKYVQNEAKSLDKLIATPSIERLKTLLKNDFSQHPHTFSNTQLEQWVTSAWDALYRRKEFEDYVVYENEEQEKQIVIVDQKNTGSLCHGCRWQNGVNEFLEEKHNLDIQEESLTPISISHSIFYQQYSSVFGLTGTMGGEIERKEIYEIYRVDTFDIPPYRPSIRKDFPVEFCRSKEILLENILQSATHFQSKKRPLLIICQDISESVEIANLLHKHRITHQLYNEIQKETPESIIEKAGRASMITIATNNAGRGTDIQLENESLLAGGLHVIVTTLSKSDRVHQQAIGRSGRQGQIGSSQTFLQASQLKEFVKISENLPSEQIINQFRRYSQIKTAWLSRIHAKRAISEQKFFEKIDYFFNLLKQWEDFESEEIEIEDLAQKLSQIGSTRTNFSEIDRNDPILKQLIDLLTTTVSIKIEIWKNLFKKIHHQIKQDTIKHWSVTFYQPCEKMILQNQWDHLEEEMIQDVDLLFNQTIFSIAKKIRSKKEGILQWIFQKTGILIQ